MVDDLTEQVVSRVPAKDAVVTVGIDQLPEILVGLHQCLHIFCRIPIVHIIVSKSVTEQQRATQLRRSGDGVHLVVASLVLIGSRGAIATPALNTGLPSDIDISVFQPPYDQPQMPIRSLSTYG